MPSINWYNYLHKKMCLKWGWGGGWLQSDLLVLRKKMILSQSLEKKKISATHFL